MLLSMLCPNNCSILGMEFNLRIPKKIISLLIHTKQWLIILDLHQIKMHNFSICKIKSLPKLIFPLLRYTDSMSIGFSLWHVVERTDSPVHSNQTILLVQLNCIDQNVILIQNSPIVGTNISLSTSGSLSIIWTIIASM